MVAFIIMNDSTVSLDHHEERLLVPYVFKTVFSVAISAFAMMSISGNVLAIITFLKTQHLQVSTNYYITSMAVSDLLYVASAWPLFVRSRRSVFGGTVSSFQCKLGLYFSYLSYSVSIENLVLITVDRFIATVFPMNAAIISRRLRAVCILLTWIVPAGIFVPYLCFSRVAAETDGPQICTSDAIGLVVNNIYSFLGVTLFYSAPLIVIIILSARIVKSLRKTNPVIQGNDQNNARRRKQNQRITKILIAINVVFFVCWTPYYISVMFLAILPKVIDRDTQEMLVIVCLYFLPFVSTAANPMILFTFSTNYRQAMKDCLRLAVVKCRSRFVLVQAAREENIGLPELHA